MSNGWWDLQNKKALSSQALHTRESEPGEHTPRGATGSNSPIPVLVIANGERQIGQIPDLPELLAIVEPALIY